MHLVQQYTAMGVGGCGVGGGWGEGWEGEGLVGGAVPGLNMIPFASLIMPLPKDTADSPHICKQDARKLCQITGDTFAS